MNSENNENLENKEFDSHEFKDNSAIGYSPNIKSRFGNNNSLKETIEKTKRMNMPNKSINSSDTNDDNSDNNNDDENSKLNNSDKNEKENLNDNINSDYKVDSEVEENQSGSGRLSNFKLIKNSKTRLIIIVVIVIAVLFLAFIILLGASAVVLKLVGDSSDKSNNLSFSSVGDDSGFWWPVGSDETTTKNGKVFASGQPALTDISSGFSSNRCLGGKCSAHYGIDVGSGGLINVYNIIATKSGTVVYVSNDCADNGDLYNDCNGGVGNYVTIDHGNGYYSRAQHMAKDSIVVNVGDSVEQGQVIGKIGQSGRCQGAHLHFQIHIGGAANNYAVDPTKYVDPSNPRPVASHGSGSQSELVKMIQYFEGTGPVSGDSYIAYKYSYDVLTIGHGVTIPYNRQKFQNHGINPDSIGVGTKLPISVVDAIEAEIIQDHYNSVIGTLNNANLSLKQNQIDALVSRHYNTGNIKGFVDAYNRYGDTIDLYNGYMSTPVTAKGKYLAGLARRRASEWKLFHEGIYTY